MIDRREFLTPHPSPGSQLDYVVHLTGNLPGSAQSAPVAVTVRYVPDKSILEPRSLHNYLKNLKNLDLDSLEAVGVAILDDVNNEVVPRWVQVAISSERRGENPKEEHGVLLEDRQPKWDNPSLLGQLRRF